MENFVCPKDRGSLVKVDKALICWECGSIYPIVKSVPILLNEANSVFRMQDYLNPENAYLGASGYAGSADTTSGLRRAYRRWAKRLSEARVPGEEKYFSARDRSLNVPGRRILVIGAGDRKVIGNVTRTDVAFATGINCICDAHDLPFSDGSFDVVVVESVLEHVCDPQRCVAEIERVLVVEGVVCAMTPFLQPVHMGAHDFTRFTYLGHRRLFRMFDDLSSGTCGGPGYSAIHLLRHLVVGITDNRRLQALLKLGMLLVTYPLRYLDPFLSRTERSYNASCAFYFVGCKRSTPISDREILKFFRGGK